MDASVLVLLDLGDVLTKGLIVQGSRIRRFRLPSVVAHRLLNPHAAGALLLDDGRQFPRLADFDPSRFPRARSYPGATEFLGAVREDEHPINSARFVGSLAAVHGSDRSLLGRHPTDDNVDALVHKALMLVPETVDDTEVVFVIDLGAKAETILRYCEKTPRRARLSTWSFVRSSLHRRDVTYRTRVLDAADCALAVLPTELDLAKVGAVLLIDVGYLRTKMALVSTEGCEQQEELTHLGIADCVQRILRDGQELGLIEDEVAVLRAFEQGRSKIELAGRAFDVHAAFDSAKASLERELERAAHRVLMDRFARRAEPCRGLAIVGGGASVVGEGLAQRLRQSFQFDSVWVGRDASFLLVEGARRRLLESG